MIKKALSAGIVCVALCTPTVAPSETVYVVDHLAVGVHENEALNSAIIKILPTGSALDVLERKDEIVKVRTDEGLEGWVDKNYVMEDKPAQLALLELEAQHVDVTDALEVAKAQIESLTLTLDSMASAGEAQETTEEATSEALREMQRLAQENQSLKEKLDSANAIAARAQSIEEVIVTASTDPVHRNVLRAQLGLTKWHWIMVLALMVLAFGSGGYLVDWSVRRRHGGFRV